LGDNLDPNAMVTDLSGNQVSVQDIKNQIYDLEGDIEDYKGYSNRGNAARNTGVAQAEISKLNDLLAGASPGRGEGGGGGGGYGGQQDLIDRSRNSPLYQAIMGGQEFGEEAIMRNAAMTGGLRSGNVQSNMYDYNVRLQNQALLSSYNEQLGGLTGLAGLPSNANQIALGMSGIGQTQAQGIIGAEQGRQDARQQGFGNLMGLGQLGIGAYKAGMFSDRRLKKNIKKIGEVDGFNWYAWDWNIVAQKMGLAGSTMGCMADEVFDIFPKAVTLRNNFMFVNYAMIGV
jgi:hypothetical protein